MARSHLRVRIAELCAEESALREILVAGTTGDAADTAERIGVRAEFERIGALINEFRAALDELPTSHRGTAGSAASLLRYADGEEETYILASALAGSDESPALSPQSPLGRVLIGAGVGESVAFDSPAGRSAVTVTALR